MRGEETLPTCLQRAIDFARRALLCAMCLSLFGAPAVLLQGYAWVDMAQKMGGIENLSDAIFDTEPCELCQAANRLRSGESSPANPAAPASTEILKLVARITDSVSLEDDEDFAVSSGDFRKTAAADFAVVEHDASLPSPPPRVA